jgi:hypothetical protein
VLDSDEGQRQPAGTHTAVDHRDISLARRLARASPLPSDLETASSFLRAPDAGWAIVTRRFRRRLVYDNEARGLGRQSDGLATNPAENWDEIALVLRISRCLGDLV